MAQIGRNELDYCRKTCWENHAFWRYIYLSIL